MKINITVISTYIFLTLIPVSYCIYLNQQTKNNLEEYKQLQSKAYVLEDKVLYEESANYKYGFDDGYESGMAAAKNEEKISNWQTSILTKGYENGFIKCYYVDNNGKHIEFPLKSWLNVEFPLNKWIPKK